MITILNSLCFLKVDEHKQEISLKLEQVLIWNDSRIIVNKSHRFWKDGETYLTLTGKFVEDCIWTPNIFYNGVSDFSTFHPTPTMKTGSPFQYFVKNTGEITMWMHESKFSLSCSMDFTWYPLDNQVKLTVIIKLK